MPKSDSNSIHAADRSKLIQSTRDWSPLPDVSLAVSIATEFQTELYVERLGDEYPLESGPPRRAVSSSSDYRSLPPSRLPEHLHWLQGSR